MKFFFLLVAFCLLFAPAETRSCYAQDAPYIVIGENVWLLDKQGEKLFLLPETYYAPIEGIDETYYTVVFNGVTGKVARNVVSVTGYGDKASETLQLLHISEKYASFTGLKLKVSPDGKEEGENFVPVGEAFTYLGSYPTGENVWYYVCYGDKYGYVLSDFCDKKAEIPVFEPIKKEEEEKENGQDETMPKTKDDNLLKILVISGVAVTVVVLLLVLILPRKGKKTRYYYET